jgi:hypothetical protein
LEDYLLSPLDTTGKKSNVFISTFQLKNMSLISDPLKCSMGLIFEGKREKEIEGREGRERERERPKYKYKKVLR